MHQQVEGKSAASLLKNSRQLGCVFQDIEPRKFSSILRKGTKVLRPSRSVQFSKDTLRHIKIRESKGPSLGVMQRTRPHERSPYAPKFEDRSQEETERQERCARGDAWKMAKSILKLKQKDKATFLSSTEVWCLPPSEI